MSLSDRRFENPSHSFCNRSWTLCRQDQVHIGLKTGGDRPSVNCPSEVGQTSNSYIKNIKRSSSSVISLQRRAVGGAEDEHAFSAACKKAAPAASIAIGSRCRRPTALDVISLSQRSGPATACSELGGCPSDFSLSPLIQ